MNRYDLIIEYWGKGPLPAPFILLEHFFLLFKMLIFCGNPKQNQIVCWARSPGDHAMHIEQFPIRDFNTTEENGIDLIIKDLLEFEKTALDECTVRNTKLLYKIVNL